MNLKTAFQFFLIVLIFVSSALIYKMYFTDDKLLYSNTDEQKNIEKDFNEKQKTSKNIKVDENRNEILNNKSTLANEKDNENILENVEYKSTDDKGNQYIIKAKSGNIDIKKEELILLEEVNGEILMVGKPKISISSKYANYNLNALNTKFYENVNLIYDVNILKGEILELDFNNNIATIYNEVLFDNDRIKMKTDKIVLNMLTGDIDINMFKKYDKVKIVTKSN